MNISALRQFIKADWQAYSCDGTRPGFRALVFYCFAVWRMQIGSKCLRPSFSGVYRFWYRHGRNAMVLDDMSAEVAVIGVPAIIAGRSAKSDKCLVAVS